MEIQYTREKLLTTPGELQKKLGSPDLCLIDVRPAEQFAQGHIPGAVHFNIFGLSLVDTTEPPLMAFMYMIHHVFELRGVSEAKRKSSSTRRTPVCSHMGTLVPGVLRSSKRPYARRRL